jgi:hypothetical protein
MPYSICLESGREFIDHCRDGSCPLGKFPEAPAQWHDRIHVCARCPRRAKAKRLPPRRRYGPGTLLAAVIRAVTFGLVKPCLTCKGRAARLDRRGWLGLLMPWR